MKTIVPPIKCQGIKTRLVPWIADVVAGVKYDRWVEPFLGSGVVAFNIRAKRALLCDANPHLIRFYKALQDGEITPQGIADFLRCEGEKLRKIGEDHYYELRARFNETHDPLDFLFINRAGFNGMIRFNQKGGHNVPFCRKPERFAQAYITKITNQALYVSELIRKNDFDFQCGHFQQTFEQTTSGDLIYCDPPYIGRHVDYYNGWSDQDEKDLFQRLSDHPGKFLLSTWHGNQYRQNLAMDHYWNKFHVLKREHFYHVGALEKNRNPMTEALVMNFKPKAVPPDMVESTR